MSWTQHLIVAPVVLPLVAGALLLVIGERRRRTASVVSFGACALLVACSAGLLGAVSDADAIGVYRLGNWSTPFGIVLVADHLSALMVLVSALLGLATLAFSMARWQRMGPHFQPLFQFLLMGLNGAFLTGDLFNLFVFFEVLLAASYGLALHGSGVGRVKAGLHYIVVNLCASMLFLLGASLIFGVTGTLNMAALAERIADVPAETRSLLHAGAALLGVTFLVKAAAWPLGMWLPRTYGEATPPVAAMFAIMTKVGVYALMRLGLLVFGDDAGASALFGADLILAAGVATLVVGAIGVLASREFGRMAGYNVLVSSGALLGAIGLGDPAVTSGALFYLVVSTLSLAAFFLLAGLIEPDKDPEPELLGSAELAPYGPVDDSFTEEDEARVIISRPAAILGASFLACTMLIAGLPPFSGFLAKLALLSPMLGPGSAALDVGSVVVFSLILTAGLATLVAMLRMGVQVFWTDANDPLPPIRAGEAAPMILLIAIGLGLTFTPEPVVRYMDRTSQGLHSGHAYVASVLADSDLTRGARPMKAWRVYPALTAFLLGVWLLLNQSMALGYLLSGVGLALGLAVIFGRLRAPRTRIGKVYLLGLLAWRVALDIVRSNLAVALIIVSGRSSAVTSDFVQIPLDLKNRYGLAILACIITAAPGTVWVSYEPQANILQIHVLDLIEETAWMDKIKNRYEGLLMEIFA